MERLDRGLAFLRGEAFHRNEDGKLAVLIATVGNGSVVFKQESKSIFERSRRLADECAGSRRLRFHTDFIPEDRIAVYPYFIDGLLGLMRADPNFPPAELKKTLRHVGEAIHEFHAQGWLHFDVKPDNILVNWTCDEEGNKTVAGAGLGDFGIAYQLVGAPPLRTRVALGNFMWRSSGGQTGSGITKASGMFSYGQVCIYALGGGDLLLLEDKKVLAELAALGITPREDILTRHFTYFGPVNEGLLKQVDSREHGTLKKAAATAWLAVKNQPELRFEVWGKELGEAALDMISGMTKPDPTAARLTIDQVLRCPWWQEP
ncbi:kinase-like protein [Parathielavia appendiculata]|uniref:Kinase-like protein n=1 Tax=Parathielavia appendiculata TaxID=2587402 RepID=A0AAN6TYQ9_9PEZI|nr:kinase-like protein [Parathielavia appendiculata]